MMSQYLITVSRLFIVIAILVIAIFLSGVTQAKEGTDIQPDNLFPRVLLQTSKGNIIVELDRSRAPITSNNFLAYVSAGLYNNTVFHRVIKNFVVQAGGYDVHYNPRKQLKPVFNESGNGLKNEMYTIAMAREQKPHSATGQFYFNVEDNDNLDPGRDWGYAVFGMVMEGTEVIDSIAAITTHTHGRLGWSDVPVKPVLLKKASVIAEEVTAEK